VSQLNRESRARFRDRRKPSAPCFIDSKPSVGLRNALPDVDLRRMLSTMRHRSMVTTVAVGLLIALAMTSCDDSISRSSDVQRTFETTAESNLDPGLFAPWTLEELSSEKGIDSRPNATGNVDATGESWNEYDGTHAKIRVHRQKFSKVVWFEALPNDARLSSVVTDATISAEGHTGQWTLRLAASDGRLERGAATLHLNGDVVQRVVLLPHARDASLPIGR